MQIYFRTREAARQFNAKRVAKGNTSKVVDNAAKGATSGSVKRFGVSLKG